MEIRGLPDPQVTAFIGHLLKKGEVYVPIQKGKVPSFAKVEEAEKVVLDYPSTVLPPKKFFQPPKEDLFKFKTGDWSTTPADALSEGPKVLLGLHNYDMQGILCLDYIMEEGNPDEGWKERRKDWAFVGVSYQPDETHFAASVGVGPDNRDGLDLFLQKTEGGYNVELLTDKGNALADGFGGFGEALAKEEKPVRFKNKLLPLVNDLSSVFANADKSPVWEKNGEKCFSCGSCTLVCPTCYCFDVEDKLELSMEGGSRQRRWDSCQVAAFTEVAGGEIFREEKAARVLHRIHRKFSYITEHYGKPFCVGCGRCIRACTAHISISEIVNDLARGSVS